MSNKIILFSIFSLVFGGIILPVSCISERVEPAADCDTVVNYDTEAKAIIDRTCAYVGCHDGQHAIDDFSDFAEISTYLTKTANNKNTFKSRVVISQDMPPSNVVTGKELTSAELDVLTCWIEGDFQ